MFVSLSGLLARVDCTKERRYVIEEFIRNYQEAKKAHVSGDKEKVDQFFKLYTTSED